MQSTAFRRSVSRALHTGLALLLGLACPGQSTAADLPDQIRIVVPLAAGSSLDGRARVIAEALGRQLKQRVIVENRPGREARSPPRSWRVRNPMAPRCSSTTTAR